VVGGVVSWGEAREIDGRGTGGKARPGTGTRPCPRRHSPRHSRRVSSRFRSLSVPSKIAVVAVQVAVGAVQGLSGVQEPWMPPVTRRRGPARCRPPSRPRSWCSPSSHAPRRRRWRCSTVSRHCSALLGAPRRWTTGGAVRSSGEFSTTHFSASTHSPPPTPRPPHPRPHPRCPYPRNRSPASATCSPDSNVGDRPGTDDAVSHSRHIHSSWAVRSNAWSRESP
jgi:hypothetical protein